MKKMLRSVVPLGKKNIYFSKDIIIVLKKSEKG